MKKLIILDLDHTLIYGSYAEQETANLLFCYNKYLKVYERPFSRELVNICKSKGDIIVFTIALKRYAILICSNLDIRNLELLSRKDCISVEGNLRKQIKEEWTNSYDEIIIIDDSPNVWITKYIKIKFLVPSEFRGDKNDDGLEKIIIELKCC